MFYLIIVNMRVIVNNNICHFRVGMDVSLGLTDRFERAAEVDQKWMPQIFMPNLNGTMVNIVPLFDPSILQKAEFFALGYPKFASFQFVDFLGIDDTDNIINALKTSAMLSGSRIRASKRNTKSVARVIQVDLFCNRSKQNKRCSHSFNENNIQANHTIIQREHQIASKKGRSRSAKNQLVKDFTISSCETVSPVRKKSTSIRPMDKTKCCAFGFSIFCSSVDQKWYLSFSKT